MGGEMKKERRKAEEREEGKVFILVKLYGTANR